MYKEWSGEGRFERGQTRVGASWDFCIGSLASEKRVGGEPLYMVTISTVKVRLHWEDPAL